MAEEDLLFVYGTLRRGFAKPMARWLEAQTRFVDEGTTPGRLFDCGSYPALVEGRSGERVKGDIYALPVDGGRVLQRLDRHEGIGPGQPRPYEYRRVRREVVTGEGEVLLCWVYLYAWKVTPLRRILSGDYLRYRRGRYVR